MEEKINMKHSTRIIGFGHVAAKIIGYMEEVDADKVVFIFDNNIEEGYSQGEHDDYVEIRIYTMAGSPRRPEAHAKEYCSLIEEHNLLAPVIEGAGQVFFFTALPSLGGFVLAELTKSMADNPVFSNIRVSAISQLPFKFEGKSRNVQANNLYQIIKENVPYTRVFDLDVMMRKDGYLQIPINEAFTRGDREIAKMVKEYVMEAVGVPLIGIDRHRIGIDGEGVTTLVCFHGCPLHCKYCMNNSCHGSTERLPHYTPVQLCEKVKVDNLYFLASGGGVCFGGGEPLLRMDFISEFKAICDKRWKITVETSLYVPRMVVHQAVKVIDEFIVDIKESDSEIYKAYTGGDRELAWNNLKLLLRLVGSERICVRVPLIPGYNSDENVKCTISRLSEIGITRCERLEYNVPNIFENLEWDKASKESVEEPKEKGFYKTMGIIEEPSVFKGFFNRIFNEGSDIDD